MERRLALAEEWLRLALNSAKAVAWDWGVRTGQWTCFGDLNAMFGVESGRIDGTIEDFNAFLHPDDRTTVLAELQDAQRSRGPFASEFRILGRDGTVRWVHSTGLFQFAADGEPERMMGMAMDVTRSRLAENKRRLSEQTLSSFFSTLPQYCYIVDPTGIIADVNAAACEALGYERSELVGMPMSTVYAPESLPKMNALLERWREKGTLRGEEMVIVSKSGENRNVLLYAGAVHDAEGKLLHSTSIQIDVTERRRALEELRAGDERLRIAAKAGRMYAFEWDLVSDRVLRSQECASVLGLDEEPLWINGRDYFPKLHPDDRPGFERLIASLNPDNRSYRTSYRLFRPEGPLIWLEENAEAFFDEHGKMVRLVGMVADITARKAADEKLEASEKLSRQIVLSSPIAMVVSRGSRERAELINERFVSLFGYTKEDLPDIDHWWPLAYPDEEYRKRIAEEWRNSMAAAAADGTVIEPIEARVCCKDGSFREVEIHYTRMGDNHLVSFIDLTERKRAEEEVRELQHTIAHLNRVASVGQMVASLTHELGQPLTAVLSNAQAAEQFASGPSPDITEVQSALADIIEDASRAGSILQNLRAIFRKRATVAHEVDLNQVVNDVRRLMRNDAQLRGVRFQLALFEEPIRVQADEVPLQQVIVNLVVNSMDAMSELAQSQRVLTVRTKLCRETNSGLIRVEDNGPGIRQEDLADLFTPFHTTKTEGLGMGLCICKTIVRSLGGNISLESGSEPGAVFQVQFPLSLRGR